MYILRTKEPLPPKNTTHQLQINISIPQYLKERHPISKKKPFCVIAEITITQLCREVYALLLTIMLIRIIGVENIPIKK